MYNICDFLNIALKDNIKKKFVEFFSESKVIISHKNLNFEKTANYVLYSNSVSLVFIIRH